MRPPRGRGGFRGGRDGGFRGGRDGGFRGGRGGGRFPPRDEGPPSEVVEISSFLHACEGDAVTKLTNEKIPYFNAPIYTQNKTQIGKVDEIFGPINECYFSIKMMEGIVATSYSAGDKFFIDPAKLLPLARFLPQPKGQPQGSRGGRGGGRGGGARGGRGGRGGGRGRGPPRGGSRGGSRGGFRGRGRF
ncbi:putative H/ACA ribonucleoprotein complex subunit 1-like protein 1 isoform X2 [Andrographis paniculata]|uniref:putative H/ACA ribonucleoprotein complex subunit 1-like protein 1 isoform X2 n=1 Tax=Andrographis paniculata TaxID=175694 RepID=UPI0021E8F1AF|nr:putative H/ACA ribonucleoprotein complex subunit 1-like protein 1 isoform X2 [Andrographis paniculata]